MRSSLPAFPMSKAFSPKAPQRSNERKWDSRIKENEKKRLVVCFCFFLLYLMDARLRVTLDNKMHGGGCGPTAGLDRANVLAFVRHVHIFDLDGELVLVQSHQTHSGIHRPLVLPSVKYAWSVQPSCVRNHIALRASKIGKKREKETLLSG